MASLKEHIEDIITKCDGVFTLEDISEYYAKTFYVRLTAENLKLIVETINREFPNYRFSRLMNSFEDNSNASDYLFVDDKKEFNHIEDVMKGVFGFDKVRIRVGFFELKDEIGNYAWFPQNDNTNWENVFYNDGKELYEKPRNTETFDKTSVEIEEGVRYIFSKNDNGKYVFSGVFKEYEVEAETRTRKYMMVDDKVLIRSAVGTAVNGVTTNEVDDYVKELISNAKTNGENSIIVSFHKVKEHFGERVRHRAPTVCNAIRKNMTYLDRVVYQSPKGNSSLFEVEFDLSDK